MRSLIARLRIQGGGSILVEFAFVVTLLVLLLVGTMVLGLIINAKLVVATAAREGGRTWAIVKSDGVARAKAADAVAGGGLKFYDGRRTLFDPERDVRFALRGDYIYTTVTYRQPVFVPLIAKMLDPGHGGDGYLTLQNVSVFRAER
jgi:hypothetical protein